MTQNQDYLEFAKDLAREAGKIMKHYYELEEKGVYIKDDKTPVTLADTEINSMVIKEVKSNFPTHGVLGEEESFNLEAQNLWVVDPLDGTQNFADQIPIFAFSIALVCGGTPKVAVVFDPILGKLLSATAGGGAYENGKRLDLSSRPISQKLNISSWVVGGIDNSIYKDKTIAAKVDSIYAQHENITAKDLPIAYALAIIASGDLDAVVSTIKTPWDVAAGGLIAQEAGAKITDLEGKQITNWHKDANGILAALPITHSFLRDALKPALDGVQ